jgi:biotin carboxyl carrier protein
MAAADMNPDIVEVEPGVYSILLDGVVYEARVDGDTVTIEGHRYQLEQIDPRKFVRRGAGSHRAGRQTVKAPMPGKIVRVLVNVGDEVQSGEGIAVIEAMKMQNELKASAAGRVTSISVRDNDAVIAGAVVAVIE